MFSPPRLLRPSLQRTFFCHSYNNNIAEPSAYFKSQGIALFTAVDWRQARLEKWKVFSRLRPDPAWPGEGTWWERYIGLLENSRKVLQTPTMNCAVLDVHQRVTLILTHSHSFGRRSPTRVVVKSNYDVVAKLWEFHFFFCLLFHFFNPSSRALLCS